MLKKRWIIPILIVLALILTSCARNPEKEDDLPPDNLEENDNLDNEDQDIEDDSEDMEDDELEDNENTGENTGENTNTSIEDIKVSAEEAYKKFTDKFPNAKVSELELERDNDTYHYEIEGYDDKNEYELKINPGSGEIIDEETSSKGDKTGSISLADVKKINKLVDKASSDAGEDFTIDEWELKIENDKPVFKIEFKDTNNKEIEYKYDVETEDLIEKDQ